MGISMFIVGFIIFSVYLYFMILNIFYSNKKQREENYPNYDSTSANEVDYDGMGNQGRFHQDTRKRKKKRKEKSSL